MRANRLFDTDAQLLPCAARTHLPGAGQLRRYLTQMRIPLITVLLVLGSPAAIASNRPTGVNCDLKEPPASAGEEFNHGLTLRVFPRAKDISKIYSGCQVVWVPQADGTQVLSVTVIQRGHAVRVWSPHETNAAKLACRYRDGRLVRGTQDKCPFPESLIVKSMAPGCVAATLQSAAAGGTVLPAGCNYE